MFDKLRENLKSIPPSEKQSVDELMLPFKGRLSFKQYLKDKPPSWGVKVFSKPGVSEFVYDLEIYTGKGSVLAILLRLGAEIVFFDSFELSTSTMFTHLFTLFML